ncbi:MAG TPA: carboxypeptidase-like regulatory domain-containing protein [Pyrinomonadaceae bacterium]|nr:carboxypeptidase-like regulatory domain-containing protein [Pyrinomonadaceae bacterium]
MRSITSSTLKVILVVAISIVATPLLHAAIPQTPRTASLRGRVVDARTGEPIAKVRVIVSGTDLTTTTDDNGEFSFDNLPAGQVELYITTVTFGLVKKTIRIAESNNPVFEIALNESAAALTESVTVSVDGFDRTESNAPSEQTLNKRELQELSSVLVGDPLRAAQALPGVAANDDYRSEFAVRGAGFDRVGLYVDGILTDNFVHTIAGGYPDTGSLSVINADTVASVSLLSSAFPARFGSRSGSILDVTTRDGNRVKPAGRFSAALSGVGGVVDGPFDGGRGAYLFAARKSYLGYLVRRFNDQFHYTNNPPVLNFADGQAKLIYDITKQDEVGFSLILGDFTFDRNRDRSLLGFNQVFRGNTRNYMANGFWTRTPGSHSLLQTRVFGLRSTFKNVNRNDNTLEDGNRNQFGVRFDVSQQFKANRLEAGLYIRRLSVNSANTFFDFFNGLPVDSLGFERSGVEQGYYVQNTWTNEVRGLALTGGLRLEHSTATSETVLSPRGSFAWTIDKWKLRLGAGRYYQFPDFEQMFGRLGNPALKSERSTHFNAGVERSFGKRTRILAEVFDREDRGLFFSLNEPRLFHGFITFNEFPFQNSLKGHARGFELTLQRRSANRLGGWLSYAYTRTELTDTRDALVFASDADQRHTVNAYANYRFNDTWNLSSELRYGSGQPVPGFFGQDSQGYFLTEERNRTRVPFYNRVDVRLSKAFLFKRWKMTLTGEVLNLFNRNNVRYAGFDFFSFDGRVTGQLDRVLPILPSAGVVIDF